MKKILIIIGSIVLAIGVALAIILPIVLNNNNSNPIEPDYRSIKAIQVTEEAYCKRDEKELAIYEGMNFRNNDSNYKFKILVDDVEYELDSNSNNEYYGEVIKVLPKENQDYSQNPSKGPSPLSLVEETIRLFT